MSTLDVLNSTYNGWNNFAGLFCTNAIDADKLMLTNWYDNNGTYWADGQPDNYIHSIGVSLGYDKVQTTRGEHHLHLSMEGI